jgi:hypothetical protein
MAMGENDDIGAPGTGEIEHAATEIVLFDSSREPFFITRKPKDAFEGLINSQYNIAKGIVSAPVLLLSSPFVEASDSFNNSETTVGGVANGVSGFGGGLVRGVVGAPLIMLTGLATGMQQVVMAAIDTADPAADPAEEQKAQEEDTTFVGCMQEDFTRLKADPLTELVLPDGMAGRDYVDPANCVIDSFDVPDPKVEPYEPEPEPNSQPVFHNVAVK